MLKHSLKRLKAVLGPKAENPTEVELAYASEVLDRLSDYLKKPKEIWVCDNCLKVIDLSLDDPCPTGRHRTRFFREVEDE